MEEIVPMPPVELALTRRWTTCPLRDAADRLTRVPSTRLDEVLMHLAGGLTELERRTALVPRTDTP